MFKKSIAKVLMFMFLFTGLFAATGTNSFAEGWGPFYDSSKKVEIKIFENSAYGQHNDVSVSVDNEYVLIGGGAWADYGNGGGALLVASYPTDDQLTTWNAKSKDHKVQNNHTLHVYAIGMRLKDNNGKYISRTTLMNYMIWRRETSTTAPHPSTHVTLPYGYSLLSGGAEAVNGLNVGSLLTASYPVDSRTWSVASKDHCEAFATQINAYAIGVRNTKIPNFGYLDVNVRPSLKSVNTQAYYTGVLSANVSAGYVLSGIGAKVEYNSNGRLLFRMAPQEFSAQSIIVSDKDHCEPDSGRLYLSMIQIKQKS